MSPEKHSQEYWNTILFPAGVNVLNLWRNPTNPQSLRLTQIGYKLASKEVEQFSIKLNDPIRPKHFVMLERAFTFPYYIPKNDIIVVFDQTVATMLTLHAGDLGTYLVNLLTY